jgi:hypothetical protein
VYTTPVAADGVLYVMSRNMLFALKEGAMLAPPKPETKDEATGAAAEARR